MTKHTITLVGNRTFRKGPRDKSWLAEVTRDLSTLPTDIVERLAMHGLQQKMADSASQSTTLDEAVAAMNKCADAIWAGEWSSRGSGEGVDEFTRVARQIVRGLIKESLGAKSPEWATFTGLDEDEQNAKLDANFADNEAVLRPAVEARIAEIAADRERKRSAAKSVKFNI